MESVPIPGAAPSAVEKSLSLHDELVLAPHDRVLHLL
jgi:hypothetical protein